MSRPKDPVDTYLLRVLVTLLTEHNLTRAAIRMNQSQPAISLALRKLRLIFQDELLVRSGNRMVPTPRGLKVLESARSALRELDRLFSNEDKFDPECTQQLFKVGCPDYLSNVFLANFARNLRRQAPNAQLMVHPLGSTYDFEQALANGDLDVVIGNWPEPPEHLHVSPLFEDEIVCLLSKDHPLACGHMSKEQYLRAPHVVPLQYSSAYRGVIDKHLGQLRVTRNVRITVPFFGMAPHLLPGSDLVFTISRHFAEQYTQILPLSIVPSPIAFPPLRFYQIWHSRNHHAEPQQWMRGILKEVANRSLKPPAVRTSQECSLAANFAHAS